MAGSTSFQETSGSNENTNFTDLLQIKNGRLDEIADFDFEILRLQINLKKVENFETEILKVRNEINSSIQKLDAGKNARKMIIMETNKAISYENQNATSNYRQSIRKLKKMNKKTGTMNSAVDYNVIFSSIACAYQVSLNES